MSGKTMSGKTLCGKTLCGETLCGETLYEQRRRGVAPVTLGPNTGRHTDQSA